MRRCSGWVLHIVIAAMIVACGEKTSALRPSGDSSQDVGAVAIGKFHKASGMGVGRQWHSAARLPDGRVIVVAGLGRGEFSGIKFDSAELYDPSADEWTWTGAMGESRYAHAMAVLADGRVLVAGAWETTKRAAIPRRYGTQRRAHGHRPPI